MWGELQPIEGFDRWLSAVPVPVVGIPWYQLAHLPDAVFIGHEVGHLVQDDFGLEGSLCKAINDALPDATEERRTAWSVRWISEVFADIYGVLTTGSAYAAVLLDLLGGDADAIAKEKQPDLKGVGSPWKEYPTRALRARVACEAVRQLPGTGTPVKLFTDLANGLESSWSSVHPGSAMPKYHDDVEKVVRAILTVPLSEFKTDAAVAMPLSSVMPFSEGMEKTARSDAAEANRLVRVETNDMRVLFAGVARAFVDDPRTFVAKGTHQRFLTQMIASRSKGKRGVEVPGFQPADARVRHRAMASAIRAELERA
jgi:hypothetical protein